MSGGWEASSCVIAQWSSCSALQLWCLYVAGMLLVFPVRCALRPAPAEVTDHKSRCSSSSNSPCAMPPDMHLICIMPPDMHVCVAALDCRERGAKALEERLEMKKIADAPVLESAAAAAASGLPHTGSGSQLA